MRLPYSDTRQSDRERQSENIAVFAAYYQRRSERGIQSHHRASRCSTNISERHPRR